VVRARCNRPAGVSPIGIARGQTGRLWFTAKASNGHGIVGTITTAGAITDYFTPTASSGPSSIVLGPDGNMWFTENSSSAVGVIKLRGAITEYKPTPPNASPPGIAPGSDSRGVPLNMAMTSRLASLLSKMSHPTRHLARYNDMTAHSNGGLYMTYARLIAAIALAGAISIAGAANAATTHGSANAAVASPMDAGADTSMSGVMHGRFGGPVYTGAPALNVTAALVTAGGGPANFSTAKALVAMLGADTVNAEVASLTRQYGKDEVGMWLKTFDFAVADSLKIATAAGIKLPDAAADLTGAKLAGTLVTAGTASDGTFQIEFLLDKAVSHNIHVQVMNDIDANKDLGKLADLRYHQISNQAFFDVAQALGQKNVKLSDQH
jgi:hypothetical protein